MIHFMDHTKSVLMTHWHRIIHRTSKKYMKQEVSLRQLTHPHAYLFYNKLPHLSLKYGILLKSLYQLQCHSPIYPKGPFMQGKILWKMSAELYHKLESDGCLLRNNTKIDSMMSLYEYSYNGFNLLKQILRPYCPNLQDGSRPIQSTWASSEETIYVLQVFMKTFYKLEWTMHREYTQAQKSVDFLNKVMKSSKYCANPKIFKEKIMDRGLDKDPPYNLLINDMTTTLDAETA